jgi:flavin reductase (DIM6/NTAB) family NADH-FMN oxidoreductase RutF
MMNDYSDLSPSQVFLEAFRRHGAGIAVITMLKADGSPTGFTATSLASLSASPPLATFNMSQTASSWSSIKPERTLLIHMLGANNVDLATVMAGDASERFTGDHWSPGPDGLPLLNGATAWLHARVVDTMLVEFSASVAVRVIGGGIGDKDDALVYQDRSYRRSSPIV